MIQEAYDAILATLPAGTDKVFRLGHRHFVTPFEAPRIIMAPVVETLTRGGPQPVNGQVEKPLAERSVSFVFYAQGKTYGQVEDLVNTLLTAIKKSGLQASFEGVRIEWNDLQEDQSQGVHCKISDLRLQGIYLESSTWAVIETITQDIT